MTVPHYSVSLHSNPHMPKKPSRVGEPVQVYLNDRDRALLDKLSDRAALPRSEILRAALRRLAADLPGATNAGTALPALIGALDGVADVPADLAARHDEYLYAMPAATHKVAERKVAERKVAERKVAERKVRRSRK